MGLLCNDAVSDERSLRLSAACRAMTIVVMLLIGCHVCCGLLLALLGTTAGSRSRAGRRSRRRGLTARWRPKPGRHVGGHRQPHQEGKKKPQHVLLPLLTPDSDSESVQSQSSRVSRPGSVVEACRKLVGPLHGSLPPVDYRPKRMDDHVSLAGTMTEIQALKAVTFVAHHDEKSKWEENARNHVAFSTIARGSTPPFLDQGVWEGQVLPFLTCAQPGPVPKEANILQKEEEVLWKTAWHRTMDDDSDDGSDQELFPESDDDTGLTVMSAPEGAATTVV